jgi:hypothetical protein
MSKKLEPCKTVVLRIWLTVEIARFAISVVVIAWEKLLMKPAICLVRDQKFAVLSAGYLKPSMIRLMSMIICIHKEVANMVKSVLSEKVEIRESKTHKRGMFAIESILKGEVVFIKGGCILKREQIFSTEVINSYLSIDDLYFLGATNLEEEERIKLYINHSCSPNCGIRGEITFVAMRDINANEELTIDYAFLDNEDYSFPCTCGERCCRSVVTGRDWKRKEIQEKYFAFFAAYLKEKILKGQE